jgi:hypothetical protein
MAPAAASRKLQYSQVRLTTVGMALMTPASLVSPGCSGFAAPSESARI